MARVGGSHDIQILVVAAAVESSSWSAESWLCNESLVSSTSQVEISASLFVACENLYVLVSSDVFTFLVEPARALRLLLVVSSPLLPFVWCSFVMDVCFCRLYRLNLPLRMDIYLQSLPNLHFPVIRKFLKICWMLSLDVNDTSIYLRLLLLLTLA